VHAAFGINRMSGGSSSGIRISSGSIHRRNKKGRTNVRRDAHRRRRRRIAPKHPPPVVRERNLVHAPATPFEFRLERRKVCRHPEARSVQRLAEDFHLPLGLSRRWDRGWWGGVCRAVIKELEVEEHPPESHGV
jgi:hypothetical protein